MRRSVAVAGTALFFAIAPGVVAGLIPWWLTRWRLRGPLAAWAPVRIAGLIMLILGAIVLVQAFARFVTEGRGTPAPVAPTDRLVVGGLYRYVRNPMYLAVVATITGQALALGQPGLLGGNARANAGAQRAAASGSSASVRQLPGVSLPVISHTRLIRASTNG